jgi:alanine racemase
MLAPTTTSAKPSTRAWIEVDLDAVRHNLNAIRTWIGPTCGVYAVVKADAYGHGIEPIVEVLESEGIDGFAVIGLDEAERVRTRSQRPILVMGYLSDDELAHAVEIGLDISLYDVEMLAPLQAAANRVGKPARVHLKVETGLNRLGVSVSEALSILSEIEHDSRLHLVGVFSHLSNSADHVEDLRQLARLKPVLDALEAKGVAVPAHFVKSHALSHFREGFFDYVRVGLAVYGFEEVIPDLHTAMTVKTVVMQRKKLKAGEGVSYGKLFIAPRDMEIAVIAMGYAEGLSLSMSERIDVLINGHRCRQLGRICMNLSVVDVTEVPAKRGDEVVVIGRQGEHEIKVCNMADRTGIRQHEIVTRLGKSLPKVYLNR